MSQHGSRIVAVRNGAQFAGILTSDDISEVFQVVGAAMEGRRRHQPPAAPITWRRRPRWTHGRIHRTYCKLLERQIQGRFRTDSGLVRDIHGRKHGQKPAETEGNTPASIAPEQEKKNG